MTEFMTELLRDEGYLVQVAHNGQAGLEKMWSHLPDLVILDLVLPDMPGEEVCAQIKNQWPDVPVLLLSGKNDVRDKVNGFSLGADDYMTKPFAAPELLARVNARLRLTTNGDELVCADLVLNTKTVNVTRAGVNLDLTPREFKLLEFLLHNQGRVLSRETILNKVWPNALEVETRVVDVYIGYLRKKIDAGAKNKLLHAVRGFGYTLRETAG